MTVRNGTEAAARLRDVRLGRRSTPVAAPEPTWRTQAPAPTLDYGTLRPAGEWLFDAYEERPALWGREDQVLWPDSESLVIASPPGVGKTTLANLVVGAAIGLADEVLGYPVARAERVLYLAMDRPAQIRRAMRRIFTEADREAIDAHLVIRPGPLPADLAERPETLLDLALRAGATRVVVDSVKDAVSKVADDQAGGAFNRAVQACNAEGVSVLCLHHQRKGQAGAKPTSLEDVYGSTWITAGAGSVLLLWGEPGSGAAELVHLKSPSTPVGPLSLELDTFAGTMRVVREWDPLAWLRNRGGAGTVTEAAQAMTGTAPTNASRHRARRRLDGLVARGLATKSDGARGGSGGAEGARYELVETGIEELT